MKHAANKLLKLMSMIGCILISTLAVAQDSNDQVDDQLHVKPITDFHSIVNDGMVHLSWIVSGELNETEYIVERSKDGVDYESVSRKRGISSPYDMLYFVNDFEAGSGELVYRIKKITGEEIQFSDLLEVSAKSSVSVASK